MSIFKRIANAIKKSRARRTTDELLQSMYWLVSEHTRKNFDLNDAADLLTNGADPNLRGGIANKSPFETAIQFKHLDCVRLMHNHGADVNQVSDDGLTPLHEAVTEHTLTPETLEIVGFLLDNGARVNAQNEDGLTPLHIAAGQGFVPLVELLLDRGADCHLRTRNGLSPVILAVSNGRLEVVRFFLDQGLVTVHDQTDSDGFKLLHRAALEAPLELIEYLLDCGASPQDTDNDKHWSPIDVATEAGRDEVVSLLQDSIKKTGNQGSAE